jgi:hypothetical protein
VKASSVTAVVRTNEGQVLGVTLLIDNEDSKHAIEVPGNVVIGKSSLAGYKAQEAVAALSQELNLGVQQFEIVPSGKKSDLLALTDERLEIPTVKGADRQTLLVDDEQAEELVRDVVKRPTGSPAGNRLEISVLSRSRSVDPRKAAAFLNSRGFEVIEIGNADTFDNGKTSLVVPIAHIEAQKTSSRVNKEIERLSSVLGVDIVVDESTETTDPITLLAGPEFDWKAIAQE